MLSLNKLILPLVTTHFQKNQIILEKKNMEYLGLLGTSNFRQLDKEGRINRKNVGILPYHTPDHLCCLVGNDLENFEAYVRQIANIRVASFPGLNLNNWKTKTCYAGPFKNLTPQRAIENIITPPEFSGTFTILMLGNDAEFLGKPEKPEVLVKDYLKLLSLFLSSIPHISRIKLLILPTVPYRQSDFLDHNWRLLQNKTAFNQCLVKNCDSPGFRLQIASKFLRYTMLNLDNIIPRELASRNQFYCPREVQPGRFYEGVHIKGLYMEHFLKTIKKIHEGINNKRKVKPQNPFYYMCKIEID